MIESLGPISIGVKIIYSIVKFIVIIWKFSKNKLEQEYYTFRILKKWNLTSLNNTFKSIYFQSLFNLSNHKSENIIHLFSLKEVAESFERQLTEGTDWSFETTLIDHLHTNPKVRRLKNEDLNIQKELRDFINEFRLNTNRARNPDGIEQLDLAKKTLAKGDEIFEVVDRLYYESNPLVNPVLVPEYVVRSEENDLLQIIEATNILLLSGISFCGKSQLARSISEKLVENGYKYLGGSDLGEAERFLRNTNEPRLFLLDDPFGHNSESEKPTNWRKVEELIKNLRTPNKLIITSRTEVLRSIKNAGSLDECSINAIAWVDLTTTDSGFLVKIWDELCDKNNVPQNTADLVKGYLGKHKGDDILQVGQLNHLSKIDKLKLQAISIEGLLHLARADSKDISVEIQKRGKTSFELFMALGLGATTNVPINYNEIGYIIQESDNQHGYLVDNDGIRIKSKSKEKGFPEYLSEEKSESKFIDELGFLQTRGFVEIANKSVWFSHPTYREAARHALFAKNVGDLDRLDRILGKTLSSLNPKTSINCAKQLLFIYNNTENSELKEIVKKHGYEGAWRSIFPGVRDTSFSFLLEILNDLSISQKERVLNRLQRQFSNSEIAWHNEIPFIDPDHRSFFEDFNRVIKKEDIANTVEKINRGEEISTSSIWSFLLHLQRNKSEPLLSPDGALHILNSDEAFIRNRMAYLLLKRKFPKDKRILNAIFKDNHPSVVFEGMKGAILGFPDYSKNEQNEIRSYLKNALEDPFVVIRANNLFTTFGVDYGSESIDWKIIDEKNKGYIWELWSELFPIFLNKYPKNLRFANSGRFGATLDDSVKYLNEQQGLKICEAYYNWIEKYLHVSLPDTYEFGVLPYLLEIITDNKEIRLDLFKRIFAHPDTNFITYSLSWCLSYWNHLSEKEKAFILQLLKSNREDQRWLVAVSLTQHKVPNEIQKLIFGSDKYFDQTTETIVTSFNSQTLLDCLNVFCGYPQPLWWLGFHHNGRELWYKIIKWILKNEFSTGFEICLMEMIGDGVNGFSSTWENDGIVIWDSLCETSNEKKRLAERLIIETARCTCNIPTTKNLWRSLIKGYDKDIEELAVLVSENLKVLQNSNPDDLIRFFTDDFLETNLLPKLNFDKLVLTLLIPIYDGKVDAVENIELAVQIIKDFSQKEQLQLDFTAKIIDGVIREKGHEFKVLHQLKNIRYPFAEFDRSIYKEINDDYELENWNSVAEIENSSSTN
jgi:hypothetical protein